MGTAMFALTQIAVRHAYQCELIRQCPLLHSFSKIASMNVELSSCYFKVLHAIYLFVAV